MFEDILFWLYMRIIVPIGIITLAIYSIVTLLAIVGGLLYVGWLFLH
jgi:hypothetical protein